MKNVFIDQINQASHGHGVFEVLSTSFKHIAGGPATGSAWCYRYAEEKGYTVVSLSEARKMIGATK